MFRAALALTAVLLSACGGGGGGSNSGGSGGTPSAFAMDDRSGLWRGELHSAAADSVPLGIRFGSTGEFQRLGEFFSDYVVTINDTFGIDGQLALEVSSSGGTRRVLLTGQMSADRASITGTWVRFVGGSQPDGSGDFTAALAPPAAVPRDIAGDWSGEMMSTVSFELDSSYLSTGAFGQPTQFGVADESYSSILDLVSTTAQGGLLQVEIVNLATQVRYELLGSLNTQGSVFAGTWRVFDLWSSSSIASDQGVFEYQLALDAAPRSLSELAGTWSGEVHHANPLFGVGVLELEFNELGEVIDGRFDEFGSPPQRIVQGSGSLDAPAIGDFSATFDDQFSKFGSDEIRVLGVVSPISGVWTGRFEHYFYGIATFSLSKD